MRGKLLQLVGFCMLTIGIAAQAQEHVTRIVVAFPPGGPQDFVARAMAEDLGKALNQNVIVENRPGANGAIAAANVLRSKPDGKTLWITSAGAATINPSLYENLEYDMAQDFAPVSLVTNNAELLVIHGDSPISDVRQFLDSAKITGVPLNMASTGTGSVPHMAIEQLRAVAGVEMEHVPYKGAAPAIADLMGKHVSGLFADTAGVISHVQSGKLKALGIAAPKRSEALPEVPTLREQGLPDIDTNNWFALFVHAQTPPETVQELSVAVRKTLETPAVRDRLSARGSEPAPSTPEELSEIVRHDTKKWAALIRSANIKLD